MFLVSESPALHKNVVIKPTFSLYAHLSRICVAEIYALFRKIFWTGEQTPQSFSLFGCMFETCNFLNVTKPRLTPMNSTQILKSVTLRQ